MQDCASRRKMGPRPSGVKNSYGAMLPCFPRSPIPVQLTAPGNGRRAHAIAALPAHKVLLHLRQDHSNCAMA